MGIKMMAVKHISDKGAIEVTTTFTYIPTILPADALSEVISYAGDNLNWDGESQEREEMRGNVTAIADATLDAATGATLLPEEAWEAVYAYCEGNLEWDSDSPEKAAVYSALDQVGNAVAESKHALAIAYSKSVSGVKDRR